MAKQGPQAGILNRPPQHLLLATFNFSGADARATLDALRGLVERELRSDLDAPNAPEAKEQPSAETGELGFHDDYDRAFLTITLGISSSGFEKLGIDEAERPQDLRPIPWGNLVDSPPSSESGDIVLQICADNLYICEHVVRRIEEEQGEELTVVSTAIGAQRYNSRSGRTSRREGRALIGFLDGTSNLDPRNSAEDQKLVFVDPDNVSYPQNPPPGELPTPNPYGGEGAPKPQFPEDLHSVPGSEPAWTKDGSYMVVRTSTFDTRSWDKLTQNDQERSVGRFKFSGASLDLHDEEAQLEMPPVFASDQTNTAVPIAAHIRKANPRGGDEDAQRRIFRRGYPLIAPTAGGLQRGLIFIAFGRTITTQFEFIVRAWIRNKDFPVSDAGVDPLFAKVGETVLGGGYYFVPPLEEKTHPWTWKLPLS
ncbi:MAG TPA: Dyp-type peroxidase [Solirubrobacterales bacterium]|nr:Dyp-type peroxidase [Solirubrobacterales bacterium]